MRLKAIGLMSGTCETIVLDGNVNLVRASYSQSNGGEVTSVKYYKESGVVGYGKLLNEITEWEFSDKQ